MEELGFELMKSQPGSYCLSPAASLNSLCHHGEVFTTLWASVCPLETGAVIPALCGSPWALNPCTPAPQTLS